MQYLRHQLVPAANHRPAVDGYCPLPHRQHAERIDFQFGQMRQGQRHLRKSQERIDHSRPVAGGNVAPAGQPPADQRPVQHLFRLAARQRRNAHRHVADQLDVCPSAAHQQYRAELRVAFPAYDDLLAGRDHLLHHHAVHLGLRLLRSHRLDNLAESLAHRIRVCQFNQHPAHVALVAEVR